MSNLLLFLSLFYLLGTVWYYEVDWKAKTRVVLVPSEVLYFAASLVTVATLRHFYNEEIVLVNFGHNYIYLFSVLLVFSVFVHMLAKYYEDRRKFRGVKKSWRDELHSIHGYISHNLVYFSVLGMLGSTALLEINGGVEVAGEYNTELILLSSFIFAFSFYRTIVQGRLWKTQLLAIPAVVLVVIYMLLSTQSHIWELPISLFVVMTLGACFIMLSWDEVFMRGLKGK